MPLYKCIKRFLIEESFVVVVSSGHILERPYDMRNHAQVATLPYVKAGASNLGSHKGSKHKGKHRHNVSTMRLVFCLKVKDRQEGKGMNDENTDKM